MLEDKYIGLALAMTSALAIGTSFVITKKGLIQAEERHGFEGDGFVYLRNPLWWAGIGTRRAPPPTCSSCTSHAEKRTLD
jgi:hypothetical protein